MDAPFEKCRLQLVGGLDNDKVGKEHFLARRSPVMRSCTLQSALLRCSDVGV